MLRKYSSSRSFSDNMKLSALTAFTAGMVNVSSLILFFSFTSNVTGHYAILAEEIANGKWFQVVVVLSWIFLFCFGNFVSNLIVINGRRSLSYITHVIPLILEIMCLIAVGIYGHYFYTESLFETEVLVALLLFAMGLQNGLTASISNFSVKTTHLTGLTTDLGIHLSLITKKKYRQNKAVIDKLKMMITIATSYASGGVLAGKLIILYDFKVFFYISSAMLVVIFYDLTKTYFLMQKISRRRRHITNQ